MARVYPPHRAAADTCLHVLQDRHWAADHVPQGRAHLRGELPLHDVCHARGGVPGEPSGRQGGRGLHDPSHGPRAERLHRDGAHRGQLAGQPLRLHRCRRGLPLGAGPRRRQRGCDQDAGADRHPGQGSAVRRRRQGQGRGRAADGLWPPRLQELRPEGQVHEEALRPGPGEAGRRGPATHGGAAAREVRAGGRILHLKEAVPQRGLLLRHHAPRHRHPHVDVHGHVCDVADRGLGLPVEGDGLGGPDADRAPPAAVRGRRPARVRVGAGGDRGQGRRGGPRQ
mmetsp:Transcript_44763/g.124467  ORF Transcript_44763/g.124467 Transcript_44763/m.124467 type:complete len:283 (+) Transcript_44763:584-1432(+)